MPTLTSILVDLIAPAVLAVVLWRVGVKYMFSTAQNFFATMVGIFGGFLITGFYKFTLFQQSVSKFNKEITQSFDHIRTDIAVLTERLATVERANEFVGHFSRAMRKTSGLPQQIIREEFDTFERLLREASSGRISVQTPHRSLMNYSDVFRSAETGAAIRATSLIVPTGNYKDLILKENKDFIARQGSIDRIFIVPRDPKIAGVFQTYINEQRGVGVRVKFVFRDEIPHILLKDMMVLDKPLTATVATPTAAIDHYDSVLLISDPHEVENIQRELHQIEMLARSCATDDCVTSAV